MPRGQTPSTVSRLRDTISDTDDSPKGVEIVEIWNTNNFDCGTDCGGYAAVGGEWIRKVIGVCCK